MAIKSRTQPERKRETHPAEKIKKKKNKKNKPHTPKVEGKTIKLNKKNSGRRQAKNKNKTKTHTGKIAEFVFCFLKGVKKKKKRKRWVNIRERIKSESKSIWWAIKKRRTNKNPKKGRRPGGRKRERKAITACWYDGGHQHPQPEGTSTRGIRIIRVWKLVWLDAGQHPLVTRKQTDKHTHTHTRKKRCATALECIKKKAKSKAKERRNGVVGGVSPARLFFPPFEKIKREKDLTGLI